MTWGESALKIFTFGEYYTIVEGALGQAFITRQVVVNVWEKKSREDIFQRIKPKTMQPRSSFKTRVNFMLLEVDRLVYESCDVQ